MPNPPAKRNSQPESIFWHVCSSHPFFQYRLRTTHQAQIYMDEIGMESRSLFCSTPSNEIINGIRFQAQTNIVKAFPTKHLHFGFPHGLNFIMRTCFTTMVLRCFQRSFPFQMIGRVNCKNENHSVRNAKSCNLVSVIDKIKSASSLSNTSIRSVTVWTLSSTDV